MTRIRRIIADKKDQRESAPSVSSAFHLFRVESWVGDRIQDTLSLDYYKEVDGVKIPFTTQVQRPNSYTLIKFSEVKHNTAIEDSVFDPPGSPQR